MRHDHQADYEPTSLTISQAAHRLGISENAVRQRIKRRSLAATKVDGIWRVVLADHEGDYQTNHEAAMSADQAADHEATSQPAVSPAAFAQLAAIRDEWLRPLLERNEGLAERAGRLEAERDQLRAEVARLRSDQEAAVAAQNRPHATEPGRPADVLMLRWRRWWRRITG